MDLVEVGPAPLPAQASATSYMMNLMVDGDDDEDVRLHMAAVCGDAPGLTSILQEQEISQWLNHRVRPYLAPPLRLAVSGDSCECVQILLSAGCNVDLEDVKGQTPLFVATSMRKVEIMKTLLVSGANPEGSKKNRCCPLLLAVRDGFAEGVKLLLDYGADPEPFEQMNTCIPGWPLHHAVVYSHFSSFLGLIQCGAVTDLRKLSNPVQPSIVSRLSIPHAILKYTKEAPEFISIFHESGGNLLQCDAHGVSPLDVTVPSSPSKDLLIVLTGAPLSLRSQCRNTVRRQIGRKRLHQIPKLEVPRSVIPFLAFQEFTGFAQLTKQNDHTKQRKPEE